MNIKNIQQFLTTHCPNEIILNDKLKRLEKYFEQEVIRNTNDILYTAILKIILLCFDELDEIDTNTIINNIEKYCDEFKNGVKKGNLRLADKCFNQCNDTGCIKTINGYEFNIKKYNSNPHFFVKTNRGFQVTSEYNGPIVEKHRDKPDKIVAKWENGEIIGTNSLENLIIKYAEYKKSSEYDEQYKYDYAYENKGVFNDLTDLENKIKSLGNPNFNSYFIGRCSGLRHLLSKHFEELTEALSILFGNDDLKNRIILFKEVLNEKLKNDTDWHNKNILVDVQTASYFLFTNDYENNLLFTKTSPYNKFAKILNLTNLLQYNSDEERYINWQEYCKNELLPEMDRVLNKKHTLLDAQDFIWFIGNNNETKVSNNEQDEDEKMQLNIPLNQILYGPPGTGKTYNTVLKAMSIIDGVEYKDVTDEEYTELKNRFDELKQKGQIEFVTFHQSYSYEEFVEGIKPYIPEWGTSDNVDIKYIGENGIFKEICKNAKQIKTDKTSNRIDFSKTRIFKMSLGANWENETEDIYSYCLDNNVVALGWGGDKDFSNCNTSSDFKNLDETWGAKAVEIFKNWMRVGDIILISNGNSNIKAIARITGNYEYHNDTEIRYCQFRNVEWLYSGDDIPVNKIYDKKLSQQAIYGFYSSAREGKEYYNSTIKTDILNDIITGTVNSSEEQPYILIIDEINRGDVSKIFGELITLIEEDKRIGNKYQMKTTLPYSKESFGVPNNLYIIGTMNTADRSIALLDTALRRRFDFEEIMPRPELLAGKVVAGINLEQLLKRINEKITEKYDRDHQIGHSYLMGVETEKDLERAYKNRILPLLNEYFYNDTKTVSQILNCSENELQNNFLDVLNKAQNS